MSLPVADRAAAARLYDVLLGAGWNATNAGVDLIDAAEPLGVDFAVSDLAAARGLADRRGMTSVDAGDGVARLTAYPPLGLTDSPRPRGSVMLDHIVLTVPDADAAIALFAGRLGMNLRLVKPIGNDVTQLFFRTATAVVEVVAGAGADDSIGLMGLAWRCDDIDVEHARLTDAGLNLSEIRIGRKRGTRVCTVREPALGTATLLIEQTQASRSS